jgi:oligoribonuclease NrnB/cAMP/cGMP phosphodiesterase (DHH superfamily)
MKCFYHNDNDGRCSAHLVSKSTVENLCIPAVEFIEMNYDKKFPLDTIKPKEIVYIVDFHISPTDMNKLMDITPNVHWIDHHKTAIEKYKNFAREIRGLRYDGLAGCVLTWIYLKYNNLNLIGDLNALEPGAPEYVRLIGDYDTWTFKYGKLSLYFYYGLLSEDTSPQSLMWNELTDDYYLLDQLVTRGKIIGVYRDQFYAEYLKSYGYEVKFEGYRCIVLNAGQIGSMSFNSVEGKYDIMISMVWNGIQWLVSLYSTTVDVSEIAKKYGGGGHVGASGFQSKELPFKPI